MESYILAPEAVEDSQNIWDFLSLDSVPAADRQIEGLLEAFEQLGRWPGKGIGAPTREIVQFASGQRVLTS